MSTDENINIVLVGYTKSQTNKSGQFSLLVTVSEHNRTNQYPWLCTTGWIFKKRGYEGDDFLFRTVITSKTRFYKLPAEETS